MKDNERLFSSIRYNLIDEGVAEISLDRPESRNAQSLEMLYEIDAAFNIACRDEAVKVIILSAQGVDFSSGHDLSFSSGYDPEDFSPVTLWGDFDKPGSEGFYSTEREIYLDLTERWRNAPKPTIAQVQGRCIAGGMMLVWACDLIVASENASFQDNTALMGMCGTEFFNHPYEMPIRKAKHFLFTGEPIGASEAKEIGMVSEVFSNELLCEGTLALARRISDKPLFALKMAKRALNNAQDQMGRRQMMETSFALHQLCHAHNMFVNRFPIDYRNLHPKVKASIERYIEAGGGDPFGYYPETKPSV